MPAVPRVRPVFPPPASLEARLRKLLLLRALRRELHHAQSVRAGANVFPIQEDREVSIKMPEYLALAKACDRVSSVIDDVIADGVWPGVVCTDETKAEMRHAAKLLEIAAELMKRCIARETPRAEPYYQLFEREEKRRWAAQRGEAMPVN
jgi:hypothetical protein